MLARCAANEGDLDSAGELCSDVARDASARGHAPMLAVLGVLESDLLVASDPGRAAAALERVVEVDLPIWYRLEIALAWAAVHAASGDLARAEHCWELASRRPDGHPMLLHQVRLALVSAEIAAVRGDLGAAGRAVRQCRSLAHEAGYAMPRSERDRVERVASR